MDFASPKLARNAKSLTEVPAVDCAINIKLIGEAMRLDIFFEAASAGHPGNLASLPSAIEKVLPRWNTAVYWTANLVFDNCIELDIYVNILPLLARLVEYGKPICLNFDASENQWRYLSYWRRHFPQAKNTLEIEYFGLLSPGEIGELSQLDSECLRTVETLILNTEETIPQEKAVLFVNGSEDEGDDIEHLSKPVRFLSLHTLIFRGAFEDLLWLVTNLRAPHLRHLELELKADVDVTAQYQRRYIRKIFKRLNDLDLRHLRHLEITSPDQVTPPKVTELTMHRREDHRLLLNILERSSKIEDLIISYSFSNMHLKQVENCLESFEKLDLVFEADPKDPAASNLSALKFVVDKRGGDQVDVKIRFADGSDTIYWPQVRITFDLALEDE